MGLDYKHRLSSISIFKTIKLGIFVFKILFMRSLQTDTLGNRLYRHGLATALTQGFLFKHGHKYKSIDVNNPSRPLLFVVLVSSALTIDGPEKQG